MKLLKTILSVGILAVGLWSCTQAPPKTEPATPAAAPEKTENVEEVIMGLEKQWTESIVKKDAAALEGLLASDFAGTSPSAHTYSKNDAIEELKSGKFAVASMNVDEVSVNVYGTTAVAFVSQEEKSKYDGKDTSGHYHYTDVWVKKDGKWQAVASHGTRYDKPSSNETAKKK